MKDLIRRLEEATVGTGANFRNFQKAAMTELRRSTPEPENELRVVAGVVRSLAIYLKAEWDDDPSLEGVDQNLRAAVQGIDRLLEKIEIYSSDKE